MALYCSDISLSYRSNWYELAACKNIDTDIFFPAGRTGPAIRQIQRAKAICQECPVANECLDYALRTNQEYGIWGCTSEDERKHIKRSLYLAEKIPI